MLLLAVSGSLGAPDAVAGQRVEGYAEAFLPPDHWSRAAVDRLAALGLIAPGTDLSRAVPTQRSVAWLLERAADLDSPWNGLASEYRDRFRAEFGASGPPAGPLSLAGSRAGAGLAAERGRLDPGWGYGFGYPGVPWNQPTPRADRTDPFADVMLQGHTGRVAVRIAATTRPGEAVQELYGAVGFGPVTAWVGRRPFAWSPGTGPGIVLSRGRFDSVGLQTDPFGLPGFLRHVGPVAVEVVVGQDDLEHSFDDAGFLATRGSLTPHPRIQIGVTRAAVFGGEGNGETDWFDVFSLLIGKHAGEIASEFDNQVVSVDASLRLPTERWLPLQAYLEWGAEDSAGAFWNVPGILAGIHAPVVPGVPSLALAVERTEFAGSCCGNPIWYRHSNFQGGWAQDGVPLGHPLAGHGREWRLASRLHLLGAALRLDTDLFVRERGIENVFADVHVGNSAGARVRLELDAPGRLRLAVAATGEEGEDWRERTVELTLQAIP